MDEITQYLSELDGELNDLKNNKEKLEAKARLRDVMATYAGEDKLISSREIAELIRTQPEEKKYLTGLTQLDDILKGFRENQLIVLAAPTKSGKTAMSIELAHRLRETNPVLILFEESAEEIVRKFIDIKEEPPVFYSPQKITGNTIAWIEKKIIEGIVKFNSKFFVIDHLHFIVPFNSDRLDTRIGQTMRSLKALAKEHNIIILLVAHLKKTNVVMSPTLEDLRDSSFIAQEADTVIMMWRQTKREHNQIVTTNNVILSVQANRRTGTTGNIKLNFYNGKFREYDWLDDDTTDTNPEW
jgi:replicative DNA helicase